MAYVKDLLSVAQQDLRVIELEGTIFEASVILTTSRNRMVIVSNKDKKMAGILTRADILRAIYQDKAKQNTHCGSVMITKVVTCEIDENLDSVWGKMSKNNLNAMPVIDHEGAPIGVLSSKCVLVKQLSEARKEDQLMHEYIRGMGYN